MNTISAIKAAQRHHTKPGRKDENTTPPQFALVLHLKASSPQIGRVIYTAAHILHDHLRLPEERCVRILLAIRDTGREIIKQVPRDLGETLIADINACPMHSFNDDLRVTLEQL